VTVISSKANNKVVSIEPDSPRLLLAEHAKGDCAALGRFIELYHSTVFSYLSRCGLESPELEQTYQDVFQEISNCAAQFDGSVSTKTWVLWHSTQAVRVVYRRKRVQELIFADIAEEKLDVVKALTIATSSADTESWLALAIRELSLAMREVLLLNFSEHLNQEQISAVVDLPEEKVLSLLRQARFTLAGGLTRRNSQISWDKIKTNSPCFTLRELLISGGPETLQKHKNGQEHLVLCDECFSFLEAIAEVDGGLAKLPTIPGNNQILEQLLNKLSPEHGQVKHTPAQDAVVKDFQELTNETPDSVVKPKKSLGLSAKVLSLFKRKQKTPHLENTSEV